jgi:FKBP-type peptidyl-prolyl cis-trans isomerase (trigger factor)
MTGQSAEEVVTHLRAEAEQSLARELVLDAAANKLGVEVADEEIDELIRDQSEEGDDVEESKRMLVENGGYERLRADLRLKKALDEIVAGVTRIPVELAAARDKLWTPEKEKEGKKMNIWTPGSEEAR